MDDKTRIIGKYNELIKLSIEIMLTWKKGNYEHKAKQIESCKNDIAFYKLMKKRVQEENSKKAI